MARYPPSDLSRASAERLAQVRHRGSFRTSRHATRADQCSAELHGSGNFAWSGSDDVEVSASRPSNDRGHANRCAPSQNADALRSCSCRTLKLVTAWSPPTSMQRSLRPASARSVSFTDTNSCLRRGVADGKGDKLTICELSPVLKDNMPVPIHPIAWPESWRQDRQYGLTRNQQSSASIQAAGRRAAAMLKFSGDTRSRLRRAIRAGRGSTIDNHRIASRPP